MRRQEGAVRPSHLDALLDVHLTSMPGVVLAGDLLLNVDAWRDLVRSLGADDAEIAAARMLMLVRGPERIDLTRRE
jgi:hypothetical protein